VSEWLLFKIQFNPWKPFIIYTIFSLKILVYLYVIYFDNPLFHTHIQIYRSIPYSLYLIRWITIRSHWRSLDSKWVIGTAYSCSDTILAVTPQIHRVWQPAACINQSSHIHARQWIFYMHYQYPHSLRPCNEPENNRGEGVRINSQCEICHSLDYWTCNQTLYSTMKPKQ
jgi:hypothetical protein